MSIHYGQVVVGAPGAGKTTYCKGMKDFLTYLNRNPLIINLDPANNDIGDINISDLITLDDVMSQENLGPNGGLIYCLEYLQSHLNEWLLPELNKIWNNNKKNNIENYLLFDLPGQVELFTHYTCIQDIMLYLQNELNCRLTCVNLVDSNYCHEIPTFISGCLLSLHSMLRLNLPHVNVLTKIDLMETSVYKLPLPLETFTQLHDINRFLPYILNENNDNINHEYNNNNNNNSFHSTFLKRYEKLYTELIELVDEFGLVNFIPISIEDSQSLSRVLASIDRSNGYCYKGSAEIYYGEEGQEGNPYLPPHLFQVANNVPEDTIDENFDLLEKYFDSRFQQNINEDDNINDNNNNI